MILSIIIPARNEFPNIVFTIYSMLHALETEGFKLTDFEIIIVDNGSNDDKYPQRGTGGTISYLFGRGIYGNAVIRVVQDPICGNHSARNKGALIARGKYLFFSDAHMAYRPGFFTKMIQACEESKGIVHGALQYLGAYPSVNRSAGFQYSIKLGEEIKGTWSNYQVSDKWFYIAAQGHWGLMVNKEQFLDFRGYPGMNETKAHLSAYGGGEFFLNMKWWLFGSCVVCEPNAIGYHLAAGRGYCYNHDDYIENVLGMSYALGMDDWRERAYINWLRHGRKEVLDKMMQRTEKNFDNERAFVEKRRVKTFNELIVERPWNLKNQERHGTSYSGFTIFHDTILPLIEASPQAKEAYNNSKYQKDLDKFIRENLSEFIYKRS